VNTLWFVKCRSRDSDVVFLFTSPDEESARRKGLTHINPLFVHEYPFERVTAEIVCRTPDEVEYFEPV